LLVLARRLQPAPTMNERQAQEKQQHAERRVRYAVIGAGHIAQVAVLPAFAHAGENSELVALISGDANKRRELAERYHIAQTGGYEELEWVLQRAQVDAVYIGTPNHKHREHTERSARAGAHVLCEKPMAPTVADCAAMIEACRDAGVRLMIAYRLHFEEANLRAVEIVQSGQLGRPRLFTSCHTLEVRPGDIRTKKEMAGGALFDLGVYPINAARYIFRDEPVRVMATTTRGDSRFDGVDATTTAVLIFKDERIAEFSASLEAADTSFYRVVGDKGDLRVEPAYAYDQELRHVLTIDDRQTESRFPKRDQFAAELVAFSRAILRDRDVEPSGEEGLCDIRVVEALLESARSGRAIDLPPFERKRHPSLEQEMHLPPVSKPRVLGVEAPSR
jgi:predicted dehydrogenase